MFCLVETGNNFVFVQHKQKTLLSITFKMKKYKLFKGTSLMRTILDRKHAKELLLK